MSDFQRAIVLTLAPYVGLVLGVLLVLALIWLYEKVLA